MVEEKVGACGTEVLIRTEDTRWKSLWTAREVCRWWYIVQGWQMRMCENNCSVSLHYYLC